MTTTSSTRPAVVPVEQRAHAQPDVPLVGVILAAAALTPKIFYSLSQDFLFPTTPSFDRDGWINSFGTEQTLALRPVRGLAWTWDLNVGYRFDHVATQGTQFDRSDHTFYAEPPSRSSTPPTRQNTCCCPTRADLPV